MGVSSEPLCAADSAGSVSLSDSAAPMCSGGDLEGCSVSLAPPPPADSQARQTAAPEAPSAKGKGSLPMLPPAVAAAAHKAASSAAVKSAGNLLKRGATQITVHIQANPRSVTVMSFVGGMILALVSLCNLLNILNMVNPLTWILQLYQLAAGLLIIVIDGPSEKLPAFLRDRALQSASFLHSSTSRVLFYLFIACQQGSQTGFFNWIVGWYFAFVAIGFAAAQSVQETPPVEGKPPVV